MSEPRKYGHWQSKPEDTTRCIVAVTPPGLWGIGEWHQCYRKRGHGPNGEYCKQHAKTAEVK